MIINYTSPGRLHVILNRDVGFYLTIWLFNWRLHYHSRKAAYLDRDIGWPNVNTGKRK